MLELTPGTQASLELAELFGLLNLVRGQRR
jgi:hypothetical protein